MEGRTADVWPTYGHGLTTLGNTSSGTYRDHLVFMPEP